MQDEQAPVVAERLSMEASIARDVPCRYCGYNLRTLSLAGKCPECGNGVLRSYRGDLLRYSNLPWLERIYRGLGLIVWAAGTICIAAVLYIIGMSLLGIDAGGGVAFQIRSVFIFVLVVWIAASTFSGVWLFTTPEPDYAGPLPLGTLQRLVRIGIMIVGLGLIMGCGAIFFGPLDLFLLILAASLVLLFALGVIALLRYIRRLAIRIPKKNLRQVDKWLLFVGGGSLILWVTGIAVGAIFQRLHFDLIIMAGLLLSVATYLIFLATLCNLRDALQAEIEAGRAMAEADRVRVEP